MITEEQINQKILEVEGKLDTKMVQLASLRAQEETLENSIRTLKKILNALKEVKRQFNEIRDALNG